MMRISGIHGVEDDGEFIAIKGGAPVTFMTFKRHSSPEGSHGQFASRAVDIHINLAVREATEKDAVRFQKFIWNGFLLTLAAKLNHLAFQALIHGFKPVMFSLEAMELLAQKFKPLSQNGGAAMLGDGSFEQVQKGQNHPPAKVEAPKGTSKPEGRAA